jgi:hypothetical protein
MMQPWVSAIEGRVFLWVCKDGGLLGLVEIAPLRLPGVSMSRALSVVLLVLLLPACAKDANKGADGATDNPGDGDGDGDGEDDVVPLEFSMTAPTSGAIVASSQIDAEGTWAGGADAVVTVNGVDVGSPPGAWSLSSSHSDVDWPDSPLWPVLGDARDSSGQWMRARSTLIHGESASGEAVVPSGLMFRLTDNLLPQLDGALDAVVADLDFAELLVGSDPVTSILGVDVYISDATFGDIVPVLDFTSSGLSYTVRVEDVEIEMYLDAGILGDYDVDLLADAITLSGDLVFGVDGVGGLTATPANTAVATENLELFGFTDSIGLVDSLLGDTIASTVEETLVESIDGLLEAQEELRYLEFSGIAIISDFVSAVHDGAGVTLLADSRVELVDGSPIGERLTTDEAWSLPAGTDSANGMPYDAGLFLDDDLLSGLGAALLATDLLSQEVGADDLGSLSLDTTLLGAIVPGFDTLPAGQPVSISTRPSAPLVGQAGRTGLAGELHLGGLELDLKSDQDGDGTDDVVMEVAVDAVIGLAPGVEGELLAIELVDSSATLVSTTLGSHPDDVEPGLATLIDLAVPLLVGDLLGGVLDIELGGIDLAVVDGAGVDDRVALYLELDLAGLEL